MQSKAEATIDSSKQLPNLMKICRLCLTENAGTINIFNADQNANVSLQIMVCAALEVSPADLLPKQICRDCRIQLERSYYFRKRSQISDIKLRKHIRLINAGKTSRIFETEPLDDDDYDDELRDSLNFLEQIKREEEEKQRQKDAELEQQIREKIRQEEMENFFEEAKSYFLTKVSDRKKSKPKPESSPVSVLTVEPSTSSANDDKIMEEANPVFEDVIDSTEIDYSSPPRDESTHEKACYVLKVENRDGRQYVVQEESGNSNETQVENMDSYTVVNVEMDGSEEMNFESLNVKQLESREIEVEQDPDEYNEEQALMLDEHSDDSTQEIYEIDDMTTTSDHNAEQIDQQISIDIVQSEEDDETGIQCLDDEMADKDSGDKSELYFESNSQDIGNDGDQSNDKNHLIEVNHPLKCREVKIFKCARCPQSFSRRSQLARHAAVHEKTRSYQCDQCKILFSCKSSMDRHVRIHTGEKPFQCNICHRRFIQKEILKRHMVIHTGKRPFACPHCDKSFVQRQMMQAHINLKHTDNPVIQMHECFLCSKAFFHASGLSRHLLTHSGVSYSCKICDKKFSDKSAVKRHTSTVHC